LKKEKKNCPKGMHYTIHDASCVNDNENIDHGCPDGTKYSAERDKCVYPKDKDEEN